MSFEGLRERIRLERAYEAGITKCVCVLIIGDVRYEQDQFSLSWPSVRHSFPDRSLSEAQIVEEWADRVIRPTPPSLKILGHVKAAGPCKPGGCRCHPNV